jgi:cation-transporting ATPase F
LKSLSMTGGYMLETLLEKHWHHLSLNEVLTLLETHGERGLDAFEVAHRQKRFGPNSLSLQEGTSPAILFLLQFHQPLVYILLAATLITAFLQEWVDSGVIFGVVLINACIGYIQESKALKAIEALARTMDGMTTVIRAGKKQRLAFVSLVPGDLVVLQAGDKVPADLRLVNERHLQVDESGLTGESIPVSKQVHVLPKDTVLADRGNMAFSSSLVTAGQGLGVVVATGDATEMGRIKGLIESADVLETPLTRKIRNFSGVLLWVILGLAGMTFLVGWLRGEAAFDMFMAAVALAVGAIPEALPAAMTIMLAIGVSRMARHHAIVRKLPAVEILGSTTVICSDKTGTLTKNQMTVQEVFAGHELFSFSGLGYSPVGEVQCHGTSVDPAAYPTLLQCTMAGLLCNDSRLVHKNGGWGVEGDPTEGALLSVAEKVGLSFSLMTQQFPRLDTIPFESQDQFMATLHGQPDEGAKVMYVKGAVERIVLRCDRALDLMGQLVNVDAEAIQRAVQEMTDKGLRVLAFAFKSQSSDQCSISHDDVEELVFLGLEGMMDPPRQEAIRAVQTCHRAGIQVKMITGDHVGTAVAIAKQMRLAPSGQALRVLSGYDIARLSDAELVEQVEQVSVFARVAPEQKLRLVDALQAHGHIVAMTGDGVNDAPALKQADIGIAMGHMGTEVAKEASDMVLTDDNFSTIEAAVEEGRGVFDNLVKFVTWTLPTNIGEGLVIMVAVFAGVTLPILPVQILWINMTTAVLLGLMLVFEAKEPGLMARLPRDPQTPILTGTFVFRIGMVGVLLLVGSFGLFEWVLSQGQSLQVARTAAVNMFVFGEMFYVFNCRSLEFSMWHVGCFSNRWLLIGVTLMIGLQLLFTYWPWMNQTFRSAPLSLTEWWLIIGWGLIIYGVVGFEKTLRHWISHKPKESFYANIVSD